MWESEFAIERGLEESSCGIGITVDSNGDVYVADSGNNRILVYAKEDSNGEEGPDGGETNDNDGGSSSGCFISTICSKP